MDKFKHLLGNSGYIGVIKCLKGISRLSTVNGGKYGKGRVSGSIIINL